MTDLGQFVSDYLQIEGAEHDSDYDIAVAYLDQNGVPEEISDARFEAEARKLAPQIAYYR